MTQPNYFIVTMPGTIIFVLVPIIYFCLNDLLKKNYEMDLI